VHQPVRVKRPERGRLISNRFGDLFIKTLDDNNSSSDFLFYFHLQPGQLGVNRGNSDPALAGWRARRLGLPHRKNFHRLRASFNFKALELRRRQRVGDERPDDP